MRPPLTILSCLLLSHFCFGEQSNKQVITVAAPGIISEEYKDLKGNKECVDKRLLGSRYFSRGAIEAALICLALKSSNYKNQLKLIPSPNYSRALRMVELGEADISAESIWSFDTQPELVLKSQAVYRWGEFEKGLYTIPQHPLQKENPDQLDISPYRGVTIRGWHSDWQALSAITAQIYSATRHDSPFLMLQAGRADFMLMNFTSTKSLEIEQIGVKMKPIAGVKVKLPGSRHFVVSRKTNKGQQLLDAINKGLAQLRKDGELQELLLHVGLNSPKTKNWHVLNKNSFEQAKALYMKHNK
ncbi:hypothetical protein [Agaribacterium sp. ZY112]|uniref:hypothetical protein n=1 Tax=Agaribacterium sp. ZY112 TaxID=3233574 RepID=UPI0035268C2F